VRSFGLFQTFFSGFALFLGTVRDLSEPHQATGHGLFSLFFSFVLFCFFIHWRMEVWRDQGLKVP